MRRVADEWCAAETGGVVLLLFLTSVRTAWVSEIDEIIRSSAARQSDGRARVISIFRLDKRFPVDIGFDSNLPDLLAGFRDLSRCIGASAVVVEFGGILALTMKSAISSLMFLARRSPPVEVHSSVVSAATWLLPHIDGERGSVRDYVDMSERMKLELGCEDVLELERSW